MGLVLLLVSLVLAVGAVFYFLSFNNKKSSQSASEVEPTPEGLVVQEEANSSPTPTSTSTPAAVIDRKVVSISILNGTGITGEAAYLQDKLEDLGYTNIKVANSSKQDYQKAVVTFSTKLSEAVKEEIKGELTKIYQGVEIKESATLVNEVEIITGLRAGQTPKSQATATPKATTSPAPTGTVTPSPSPTGSL